ncbi:MAG: hypothetical protein EBU46_00030 [Nitrosomonadaceae bacterium]|nr:hypothetical protein [Nitrosomonadaceae bacterium]
MKTITLQRKAVSLLPGTTNYKLSLSVTSVHDITDKVFVKRRLFKFDNTFEDVFVAVASPAQIEELPVDAPSAPNIHYRSAKVDITSSDPQLLEDIFTNIIAELQMLTDQLTTLDEMAVDGTYSISKNSVELGD